MTNPASTSMAPRPVSETPDAPEPRRSHRSRVADVEARMGLPAAGGLTRSLTKMGPSHRAFARVEEPMDWSRWLAR